VGLKRFLSKVLGNSNDRELRQMQPLVGQINDLETAYEALSDAALRAKTDEFLARLAGGETCDDILVEAFAAVREASKRVTGMRHYDVQLLGGVALHRGRVVEMKTGEGKTLVATLPLYLNALTKRGAHLVTVNDYLARRDVQWMGGIYHLLGISVGLLQQGQDQSFVFDPDHNRGEDDYRSLRAVHRREAYRADITYGTNNEFGFDYLRDNSAYSLKDRVQRGFHYAIVDEVDNILIDEARTPLIISGPATEPPDEYYVLAKVVRELNPDDFEIDARERAITLTDAGYDHVERVLGQALFDPDQPEEMTPQQAKLLHHLEQALKAEYVMQKNRDYIIQSQRVVIVDEFTGRLMPGRRWSDGLHQAVEAKEGVPVRQENITYATITLQNYFRMYDKLAGMTGTAATEAEEFEKIYSLGVLVLPTHRPVARQDHPDVILRTAEAKIRAVVQDIMTQHCLGRPVLVGTTSVSASDHLSSRLQGPLLRHLCGVILMRDHLNTHSVDNDTYREAVQVLNQPLESLSASQLRKLSDRLEISTDLRDAANLDGLASVLHIEDTARLERVLRDGVQHSVLNARHHTEEARIVARAGEIGAVTIATNMAGRGVDIKLGGELDEGTLSQINRVLRQNDISPYDLAFEGMADALEELDPDRYYLYRDAVESFIRHVADEQRVKDLGGLHVIGTERHEARRIDNQLRGRAGRQGDLGSSTFYLSLEDDLMRRFGGTRVADIAARLGAEDDMPVSMGIVSRAIANAQTQVEGHNFDIRKHLLEYDDVLNTQREVIYEQRKRILSKPDLREDVWEMVRAEIGQRLDAVFVTQAEDDLGTAGHVANVFYLIHYLETVQPATVVAEGKLFPSFSLRYVMSVLPVGVSSKELRDALSATLREALESQRRYGVQNVERHVYRALVSEEAGVERMLEAASMAYEGIEMERSEAGQDLDPKSAAQVVSENTQLKIDAAALADLRGRQLERAIMDQVSTQAQLQARLRTLSQVKARAGIDIQSDELLVESDRQRVMAAIHQVIDQVLIQERERVVAEIDDEIEALFAALARHPADIHSDRVMRFLHDVCYATRTQFDQHHRRVSHKAQRLQFTYWVAEQVAAWDRDRLESEILSHLQDALLAWEDAWGRLEMQRVSAHPLADLDESTREGLGRVLGKDWLASREDTRVSDLPSKDAEAVRRSLGEQVLLNVQRQLMLDITSRYWVEHLTAMEVLRQGIGLQSYAQKDPLAEYKVRAYDMFQELLRAIQTEIVMAMFTYRPRDLAQVRVGLDRRRRGDAGSLAGGSQSPSAQSDRSGKKKRRRRKRR
jgi:preprotein translocase subunit SecA